MGNTAKARHRRRRRLSRRSPISAILYPPHDGPAFKSDYITGPVFMISRKMKGAKKGMLTDEFRQALMNVKKP